MKSEKRSRTQSFSDTSSYNTCMLAFFTLPSAQQFFLHNQRGEPVLRPMWVHYSEAEGVNEIADQFMVGFNLIVKPVLEKGAT